MNDTEITLIWMLGEFVFVFVSARFSCKPRVLMVHFSVQCYFIHFLFLFVHFWEEICFLLFFLLSFFFFILKHPCKLLRRKKAYFISSELNLGTSFFLYQKMQIYFVSFLGELVLWTLLDCVVSVLTY